MKHLPNTFDARIGAFGDLDSQSVAAMIHAAADVALLVGADGVIRDLALGPGVPLAEESRAWLGQEWVRTVTPESQPKVREMLHEVVEKGVASRRQVNHPTAGGLDLPVAYAAVRLGRNPGFVAIGRDLRAVAELQQRLIEAQQAMERDYRRMRHSETRYRLLCQLCSEAVLMVDATTLKITDANPAAGRLFDLTPKRLIGKTFPVDFDRASARAVEELFATVRSSGRTEETRVRLAPGDRECVLAASLVPEESPSLYLVRMLPREGDRGLSRNGVREGPRIVQVMEKAPDGFVVADLDGQILTANRAFLDLAELASEQQARGQSLSRWLGRPGADLDALLATLREHGIARLFATSLRGEFGSTAEVEISAGMTAAGVQPWIGLVVRDVGRRLAGGPQGARDLTRAVEQLTGLVGRVSLRDLVRDTTDLVERHFIEAALELTRRNRTSAAEVLGVSRQSLYVKLRRYQLGGAGEKE